MIVKQFKQGETEILITQNDNGTYNAIKLIKGEESEFHHPRLDLEACITLFNIWLKQEPMFEEIEACND